MLEMASNVALVAAAVAAAVLDVRTRRIPNVLTFGALAVALVLRAAAGPEALLAGLAGAGVALVAGFVLFALGGMGGGDGKLMMALGAYLGLEHLLAAFVLMGLAGGVLAVVEAARRGVVRRTLVNVSLAVATRSPSALGTVAGGGSVSVPYGVAIAFGAVAAVVLG